MSKAVAPCTVSAGEHGDPASIFRRLKKTTFAAIAGLSLLLLFSLAGYAQMAGGSITGTVTAASGAVVPGVRITVKDVGSGLTRAATTNTAGLFNVPDVPPGNYEMTVAGAGFTTQDWTSVSVTAGIARVLNVTMRPGDPTQIERVVAPPAMVSEPCPSTCGAAGTNTAQNTPLNGRDWAALTTLQAGVTGVQNGSATGGGNTDRGFGAAVSISGSRPDQNSYRLDGISINDYANGAPGSVLGDNLGIDAVQQVSVLGNNYPAEYGRTSGGVINVETKAGTNAFHGSLYEFLRNSSLDARNFFDGPVIPSFKRNQFGGSGGAPLQKDRTFVFGDYEGLRQSLGVTTVDHVPSDPARGGTLNFSDPSQFPAGCAPTGVTNQCQVTVDPAISSFLNAFYPHASDPVPAGSNTGVYRFAAQEVTTENYFTVRLDHKFSDSDSVYVTYMRDNSKTVQPDTYGELFSDIVSGRQEASLHEQHIFSPNLLNAARVGFNRAVGIQGQVSNIVNPAMSDPAYSFTPGGFAGSISYIPGVTNFSGAPTAAGFLSSSKALYWTSYQAGDDLIYTAGRHTVKFGGEVERMQDNIIQNSNINGTFRFDTLYNFLTNRPSSFSGTATGLPPDIGLRETLFGAYVEDDIRMRKTFTLNAGFRYEMVTVPTEAHNRTTVLKSLTDPTPSVGTSLFSNPTLRNFEPRLGFAYNPRGGKTLIRGGFGIFDVLPLPYEFTLSFQRAAPIAQTVVGQTNSGEFPTGAFNRLSQDTQSGLAYYAEPNPKRNYVMQWNLSVAQELTNTLALTVGYVGSRGVHQPYRVDNIDMVGPTLTSAGYMWSCGPTGPPQNLDCGAGYLPNGTQTNPLPSSTINPNFGRINATLWQANSFYDALQADLQQRVAHGLTFHAAYTFGKSIDTLSATEANDAFPNGLFNQLYTDQSTTRGLSDFNVAQTFVLSFTWQIPGPKNGSEFADFALDGWQVGGLYKASTGQPFTPIFGGDPVGTKLDETGLVPSVLPGCQLTDPNFKKNILCPVFINPNCFALPSVPTSALASLPYGCAPFPGASAATSGQTYCANLRGNLGRNVVIGPGLSKLDFSVFKNNQIRRISETFNVQFRAEIFNIMNRANFSSPTDNLEIFDPSGGPTSSGGQLTSTQTTSRQIQFAIKLMW
ncbi:MAG: carboxypeptidase regulatory-like domain-containing protein [Candidatus Acidiferrales bacterium]